jgi:hypothetical protein
MNFFDLKKSSSLDSILDAIPKIKKNRRCTIHSLDMHKIKNLSDWSDAWNGMTVECRKHLLHIKTDNLLFILDNYLKKHRYGLANFWFLIVMANRPIRINLGPTLDPLVKTFFVYKFQPYAIFKILFRV